MVRKAADGQSDGFEAVGCSAAGGSDLVGSNLAEVGSCAEADGEEEQD